MNDTIAAIATGPTVSAIGIVRISGDKSIYAAEKLFKTFNGKQVSEAADRKLLYGQLFSADGELLDECMCTVSRAPGTYTGEDTTEFQCHGSPIVLRTVLDELFKLGIRQAKAGEFTKRAFLNGRMDLTSAEAVADLIDAETVEAAKNAAGQLSGAISRKTDKIYSDLTDICAHFHAVLDYPDEDIEEFEIQNYKNNLENAHGILIRLKDSFERGKMMNSGIPTAIIGRPNAGKSSLLNALLGYDRAIVTAVPGTTRDTIEERVKIGGLILKLIDTAGIRETDDEAEKIGVERSFEAVRRAALIIAVVDGTEELTEKDEEIIRAAERAGKGIVVVSKLDRSDYRYAKPETALPVVEISSKTGAGIEKLEEMITKLFPLPVVPAGEILTNARQAEAVETAAEYIKSAVNALESGETPDIVLTEVEGAMNSIGELNGKTIREDVTNRIFARFCVGK